VKADSADEPEEGQWKERGMGAGSTLGDVAECLLPSREREREGEGGG
jgi:hypothetical protein